MVVNYNLPELQGYIDGKKAEGVIVFLSNPTNGQTKNFNGVPVTFMDVPVDPLDCQIGVDLATTMANAGTLLNASADVDIAAATYVAGPDFVLPVAVEKGAAGNAYDLTGGDAPFSIAADTLVGGLQGAIPFKEWSALLTANGPLTVFVVKNDFGQDFVLAHSFNGTYDGTVSGDVFPDRKSTRLNSSHGGISRMPSSA